MEAHNFHVIKFCKAYYLSTLVVYKTYDDLNQYCELKIPSFNIKYSLITNYYYY